MGNSIQPEGDNRPAESKSDRLADKAETKERGEAASELQTGSLNARQVSEKRAENNNRAAGEESDISKTFYNGQRLGLYDGDKQLIPENKEAYKEAQEAAFKQQFGDPNDLQGSKRPIEQVLDDLKQQAIKEGAPEEIFQMTGVPTENRDGVVLYQGNVSNVPEVTKGVQSWQDVADLKNSIGDGLAKAFNATVDYLSKPGAVTESLDQIGPALDTAFDYYWNTPLEQKAKDAEEFAGFLYHNLEDSIGHPMSQAEIGEHSGEMMPGFFPLGGGAKARALTEREIEALGGIEKLEKMSAQELEKLGLRKVNPADIVNPIDKAASSEEKVMQLQKLSAENQPLIDEFTQHLDKKYGSLSFGSPKDAQKIIEKAARPEILEKKPWFGIEHIRDSQRFTTVIDNLDVLPKILEDLKASKFEIVEANIGKMDPNSRGWRMMPFDLRAPNGQLIEFQVVPREMHEAGKLTHSIHEKWRGKAISDIDELSKDLSRARKICDNAWDSYLKRTGQTPEHIEKILEKIMTGV